MKSSRFTLLLSSLSVREQKSFKKFINSPFSVKDDTLRDFLNFAYENLHLLPGAFPTKREAHIAVFGKVGYKEQRISDLMTYGHRALNDFFIQRELSKNTLMRDQLLNEALIVRKPAKGMNQDRYQRFIEGSLNKQLVKTKDQCQCKDEYYLHNYKLTGNIDFYNLNNRPREDTGLLDQKIENLEKHYVYTGLLELCEMKNRIRIISADYNTDKYVHILELVRQREYHITETPIAIYYHIFQLLNETEADESFFKLCEIMNENAEELSGVKANALNSYLLNYCFRRNMQGEAGFLRFAFERYCVMLDQSLLTLNSRMDYSAYKNIVTLSCRFQKSNEWTYEFIEGYKSFLANSVRLTTYNFCMAYYLHYTGAYDEAIKILEQVNWRKDLYFALDIRALYIKLYFENPKLPDVFQSKCNSYSDYISRSENLTPIRKQAHREFVSISRALYALGYADDFNEEQEKISLRIKETKYLVHREWLNSKCNQAVCFNI